LARPLALTAHPAPPATLILKKLTSLRRGGNALKLQQEVVLGEETGDVLGSRSIIRTRNQSTVKGSEL